MKRDELLKWSCLIAMLLGITGCKVGGLPPEKERLPENVMSRNEALTTVQNVFQDYKVRLEPNVLFQEEGLYFRTCGYDHDMQIGFVYQPLPPTKAEDLSYEEEKQLNDLAKKARIYFFVMREGSSQQIMEEKAKEFMEMLVNRGSIKLQKGSVLTPEGKEGFGEELEFEKAEGRKVDPGKIDTGTQQENPDEVLENIKREEEQRNKKSK